MKKITNLIFVSFLLFVLSGSLFADGNVGEFGAHNAFGKAFKACGKEWLVGPVGWSWKETQVWINSLKAGWRSPTIAELKKLYNEVGKISPIKEHGVWGEKSKEPSFVWRFNFSTGSKYSYKATYRAMNSLGVAVRSGNTTP
ncbi:MAG: hypothetical protein HQM10_09335 [Candidatus Riflebacteria bacterium]|nr:hypothetical protein [Candidatus Riflebacteria bacterium]